MAQRKKPFDEVMIVNPTTDGGQRMRMYPADDEMAGHVGDDDLADPPPGFTDGYDDGMEGLGYVAEGPYQDLEGMGFVADDEMGEEEEFADAEDEMGYYTEGMNDFADDEVEGYVVENREPAFSPRVVPTQRLAGVDGYVRPKTVNPSCRSFEPAEEVSQPSPTWFKPLW